MNRTTLFIAALMSISAPVFAEQAPTQSAVPAVAKSGSSIRVGTRPEILGLWGMKIPDNKKCTEYYNFRGGNELVVNSAKEWSTGLYDYQPAPDNTQTKLPALIIQIKFDNNQADCSGQTEDQAGEMSQYYVRWLNANTINFCMTETGDKCVATLHRVRP
ncbi:hypothetical protein EC844_11737 [Acinetobacter calcoaceticus]|uniref:Uncharacterized protein n=1 Tax=Acinetobacter calcoaceticus TaxID=471 RepID=A0A4V2R0F4_ACICA|nr:hypothetical protein EC844_11737 [Acinetobacter calcoaceticus]